MLLRGFIQPTLQLLHVRLGKGGDRAHGSGGTVHAAFGSTGPRVSQLKLPLLAIAALSQGRPRILANGGARRLLCRRQKHSQGALSHARARQHRGAAPYKSEKGVRSGFSRETRHGCGSTDRVAQAPAKAWTERMNRMHRLPEPGTKPRVPVTTRDHSIDHFDSFDLRSASCHLSIPLRWSPSIR
jgi:hypothetical protein